MAEVVHTSGGKGIFKKKHPLKVVRLTESSAYVASATALFVKAFETDPVILWLLSSMVPEARTAYLPQYFNALLTAAAMNEASFMEANNWESCSVLMPPGKRVDNTWTMLQAGFVPVLWNIGVKGVHVRTYSYFSRLMEMSWLTCTADAGRIRPQNRRGEEERPCGTEKVLLCVFHGYERRWKG